MNPRDHRLILRSPELVRAAREGRKTQDRVLVKPQPVVLRNGTCCYPGWNLKNTKHYEDDANLQMRLADDFCPFRVGDRVWCAEKFWYGPQCGRVEFDADMDEAARDAAINGGAYLCRSVHLAKKFARIWYTITGRRVERLRSITDSDIEAEGFDRERDGYELDDVGSPLSLKVPWILHWNSLHPNPGERFEDKPWVWVLVMERTS